MPTNGKMLDFMRESVERIRQAKQASTKGANVEPGGTSHPVAKADDNTQPATEGSRSAENTADVKKDVGPQAIDNAKGLEGGGKGDHQLNIGLAQSATGEDPSSEDPSKINKKDDVSTSHPAKGDVKQSSQIKEASDLGESILAEIAVLCKEAEDKGEKKEEGSNEQEKKEDDAEGKAKTDKAATGAVKRTPENQQPKAAAEKSAAEGSEDFKAGQEAAKLALEKVAAANQMLEKLASNVTAKAQADAQLYAEFLSGFLAGEKKAAEMAAEEPGKKKEKVGDEVSEEEGESHEEEEAPAGEAAEEGAEAPPAGIPGGAGAPPADDAGAAAALAAMGAAPGGGGPPMDGMDGMGGMGGMGGAPAGGLTEEELAAALQQAIAQAGLTPEAKMAAAKIVKAAQVRAAAHRQAMTIKKANMQRAVSFFSEKIAEIKTAQQQATPAAK